ncbi:MAG: hypothetical protein LUJ09_02100 [Firmicutes bacterium]|nr:hypothetical protein [Bacillota bacterium]
MKKKKRILPPPVTDGVSPFPGLIKTDLLGSYTGVPADPEEEPVQDVDDL